MFGKVCLLVAAVIAVADSTCYDECLSNMGCGESSCVDVWANCCLEHGCDWTRKCNSKQFMKAKVRGTCKVKNGKWKDGRIECEDPFILNLGINQINDFDCIRGQVRWQYDASTEAGINIPGFPICSEFGAIANTGEDESLPSWDVCEDLDCFDGNQFDSQDAECVEHCEPFDRYGLRSETGETCCVGDVGAQECVTRETGSRADENLCQWMGCGWRWSCSAGFNSATARVWPQPKSTMKTKYQNNPNNAGSYYTTCVSENCGYDYNGNDKNAKVCSRCHDSLTDSGISWPTSVPTTCNVNCK